MVRVIGSVARWTARTSTDKTIAVPSRSGPIVGGFLQRIAVLIPRPQLVEGSLVATWRAMRCGGASSRRWGSFCRKNSQTGLQFNSPKASFLVSERGIRDSRKPQMGAYSKHLNVGFLADTVAKLFSDH
jgi:hypothetical protein